MSKAWEKSGGIAISLANPLCLSFVIFKMGFISNGRSAIKKMDDMRTLLALTSHLMKQSVLLVIHKI